MSKMIKRKIKLITLLTVMAVFFSVQYFSETPNVVFGDQPTVGSEGGVNVLTAGDQAVTESSQPIGGEAEIRSSFTAEGNWTSEDVSETRKTVDVSGIEASATLLSDPLGAGVSFAANNPFRYNYANTGGWTAVTTGETTNVFTYPENALFFQMNFTGVDESNHQKDFYAEYIHMKENTGDFTDFSIQTEANLGRIVLEISKENLAEDAEYELIIAGAIASNGGDDVVAKFKFKDDNTGPSEPVDFAAIFLYPVNDFKNMPVDSAITIAFNKPVKNNTTKDDRVVLSAGNVPIDADLALNDTNTVLTVTPKAPLEYGTDYELLLTTGITSNDNAETLAETKLSFSTKSFEITEVTADINSDSMSLPKISIKNLSAGNKTANIRIEIRRDLGARMADGGTVVYLSPSAQRFQNLASGIQQVTMSGDAINLTKDLYGEDVAGDTYIDVYVLDGQGRQIGDTFQKNL